MRALRVVLVGTALLAVLSVRVGAQGVGAGLDIETVEPKRIQGLGLVYSAKFLCGTIPHLPTNPQEPAAGFPLAPGSYRTAVNIHNPNNVEVRFRKKALITNPQGQPRGRIGQLVPENLKPDEGLEVDCDNIKQLLGNPDLVFIKGFVVVITTRPLDVVAVYTLKNVVDDRQLPAPVNKKTRANPRPSLLRF